MKDKHLNIRTTKEIIELVTKAAKKECRTKSQAVEYAIIKTYGGNKK